MTFATRPTQARMPAARPLFRRGLLIAMLGLAWVVVDSQPADAQGFLRRLGNRLRGGPPPTYRPPANPSPPRVTVPATRPPVSRYRVPISPRDAATQQNDGSDATPPTLADHGYLGIEGVPVGTPVPGVQIVSILPDSELTAAGLRTGDILIGLNGSRVGTIEEMARILSGTKPGQQARVRLVRAKVAYDARVVLVSGKAAASRPAESAREPDPDPVAFSPASGESPLSPSPEVPASSIDLADQIGLTLEGASSAGRGLTVRSIAAGSAASAAGLRAGDRIVSGEGRFLRDQDSLIDLVSDAKTAANLDAASSGPITPGIVRDERLSEIKLSLEPRSAGAKDRAVSAARSATESAESDTAGRSVIGGLGSMLGGMFRTPGDGKPADKVDRAKAENLPVPAGELPQPVDPPADPPPGDGMALGDDEPIDVETFDSPPERDL